MTSDKNQGSEAVILVCLVLGERVKRRIGSVTKARREGFALFNDSVRLHNKPLTYCESLLEIGTEKRGGDDRKGRQGWGIGRSVIVWIRPPSTLRTNETAAVELRRDWSFMSKATTACFLSFLKLTVSDLAWVVTAVIDFDLAVALYRRFSNYHCLISILFNWQVGCSSTQWTGNLEPDAYSSLSYPLFPVGEFFGSLFFPAAHTAVMGALLGDLVPAVCRKSFHWIALVLWFTSGVLGTWGTGLYKYQSGTHLKEPSGAASALYQRRYAYVKMNINFVSTRKTCVDCCLHFMCRQYLSLDTVS